VQILIISEKPKIALKIAANGRKYLGDFYINNSLLTKNYLEKNEALLARAIKKEGCLKNEKYIISFAEGHLVTLNDAKDYSSSYKYWRNIPFPYVPEPFKTKVISGKEYIYNNIKNLMTSNNIKEIINACDADREGSNIFHLIYAHAKCTKPVKRLWVESHTEEKLLKALKNMEDERLPKHYNLKKAGFCRTKSDWLLGALLTAKATIELSQGKDIITVGRVQTAVLAEIVRVELLNRNFKTKKFYHILAKFKTKDGKIYEGICNDEDYEDIREVKEIISKLKKEGKINDCGSKISNQYCPPLHDQTSLAIEMSKSANMSPDQTLKCSQSLYEKGYATYPRTSSRYITQSDANDFEKMLKAISSINSLALRCVFDKSNKRIIDDSKVESHIAIIPTPELPNVSRLNNDERLTYEALVKRVIALNFPVAVDKKQFITTNVSNLNFKSFGVVELERGWREVYNIERKDNPLVEVNKNDIVEVISLEPKEVVTQPPKRYTEATILSFMETCGRKIKNEEMRELMKNKGIGTSATRAEILRKLKNINYIELKGKTIYPTEKGIWIIETLPISELKNAEFTGQMEEWLYNVEKGKLSSKDYMNKILDLYKKSCNKLSNSTKTLNTFTEETIGKCPLCNSSIAKRESKYGVFYGCLGYRNNCKFIIGKIAGKTLTENQVKILLKEKKTKEIKGFKKKNGESFSAKLKIEKDGKINFSWS
jgi:DNA topoisomerase-3